MQFLLSVVRFWIVLYIFDVVISRVGKVFVGQFDTLVVNHDRGSDDPFVDVFGAKYSLHPLLVQ